MYWPRYRSVNTSSLVLQIFVDKISIMTHQNFLNYVVYTARYTCGNTEMDPISKTIQLRRNQFNDRMGVRLTCFTLTDTTFQAIAFSVFLYKINNTIRCPCQFQNLFHCCFSCFYPLPFFYLSSLETPYS